MEPISVGLWGHPDEGVPFEHKGYDGIKRINVFCGWVIDSIEVQYRKNGSLRWTNKVGGEGGNPKEIIFDDDEYLTEVTGHYGHLFGMGTINSLTFITNRNKYGPYGTANGTIYTPEKKDSTPFHLKGGKIVGFQGNAGPLFLAAIGFFVSSLPHLCCTCGKPCLRHPDNRPNFGNGSGA